MSWINSYACWKVAVMMNSLVFVLCYLILFTFKAPLMKLPNRLLSVKTSNCIFCILWYLSIIKMYAVQTYNGIRPNTCEPNVVPIDHSSTLWLVLISMWKHADTKVTIAVNPFSISAQHEFAFTVSESIAVICFQARWRTLSFLWKASGQGKGTKREALSGTSDTEEPLYYIFRGMITCQRADILQYTNVSVSVCWKRSPAQEDHSPLCLISSSYSCHTDHVSMSPLCRVLTFPSTHHSGRTGGAALTWRSVSCQSWQINLKVSQWKVYLGDNLRMPMLIPVVESLSLFHFF